MIPGRRLKPTEVIMSLTKTTIGDLILLTQKTNVNLPLSMKMK